MAESSYVQRERAVVTGSIEPIHEKQLQSFVQQVLSHRDKMTVRYSAFSQEHDEAAARTLLFLSNQRNQSEHAKWKGYYRNFFREELRRRLK